MVWFSYRSELFLVIDQWFGLCGVLLVLCYNVRMSKDASLFAISHPGLQ